jgi:N-acetylglucosamine kinase-like BadF-type ATPase
VPTCRRSTAARVAEYVLAVDGGNSKTEVVVATTDGELLARTRGPGVRSPLRDPARWCGDLISLVDSARREASVAPDARAASAAYFLANVDLPAEHQVARRELAAATPAEVTVVHNDTLAVLRAGARHRWGIAVVAGAGMNAVGVDPDGRTEGFLALGDITGDFGGGQHVGVLGLGAAIRAADGRGPATALTAAVPAHFTMDSPEQVAVAVRHGEIRYETLHVLAPVVFAVARAGDPVARGILAQFAGEVVTMATTLMRRLRLADSDVEVILGGGAMRNGDPEFLTQVMAGISAVAPAAQVSVLDVVPAYGALVEAFDLAGADHAALRRLRPTMVS